MAVPLRANVTSQDLVSLPALRALLQERNVTRAGAAIGLSQPATSNALARLRRRFDDELLVRVGRDYEVTPLGQSLLERANQAYDALERLFESSFDPRSSTREFSIIMSDYSLIVLSQALTKVLRAEAPRVRLNLQQFNTASMDFGDVLRNHDGLILPPDFIHGYPSSRLLSDRWACLIGSEALVGEHLTIDDLAALPWVASFGASVFASSPPVRQLRALGVEPQVEVTVESFQALPHIVAGTDRIAFIPERLALRVSGMAGVRVAPSPLPGTQHLLSFYWDAPRTNDPGHMWFRDALHRAAAAAMQ